MSDHVGFHRGDGLDNGHNPNFNSFQGYPVGISLPNNNGLPYQSSNQNPNITYQQHHQQHQQQQQQQHPQQPPAQMENQGFPINGGLVDNSQQFLDNEGFNREQIINLEEANQVNLNQLLKKIDPKPEKRKIPFKPRRSLKTPGTGLLSFKDSPQDLVNPSEISTDPNDSLGFSSRIPYEVTIFCCNYILTQVKNVTKVTNAEIEKLEQSIRDEICNHNWDIKKHLTNIKHRVRLELNEQAGKGGLLSIKDLGKRAMYERVDELNRHITKIGHINKIRRHKGGKKILEEIDHDDEAKLEEIVSNIQIAEKDKQKETEVKGDEQLELDQPELDYADLDHFEAEEAEITSSIINTSPKKSTKAKKKRPNQSTIEGNSEFEKRVLTMLEHTTKLYEQQIQNQEKILQRMERNIELYERKFQYNSAHTNGNNPNANFTNGDNSNNP